MLRESVPNLSKEEKNNLIQCITSGYVASDGEFLPKFAKEISKISGGHCTLTSSGSSALHTSLLTLNVGFNDLVICPSYSFIAPINAIKLVGAEPWFFDINEKNWALDENLLESELKKNTFKNSRNETIHRKMLKKVSAIIVVYTLGLPAHMDKIKKISKKYNLKIIADAAGAFGAEINKKKISEMGADLSIISFNSNKIITSGGGGAVISSSKKLQLRAFHLASNAKMLNMGYEHDAIGYNHRMNNIQAAVGFAQIKKIKFFLKTKKRIRKFYIDSLKRFINSYLLNFPSQKHFVSSNWLSGFLVLKDIRKLRIELNKNKISSKTFWKPIHLQKPYKNALKTRMNITNKIWEKVLILPSSTNIKKEDLLFVVKIIKNFLENKASIKNK